MKVERIAAAASLIIVVVISCVVASTRVVARVGVTAAQESQPSQQEVASKTAKFGTVEKTDALYKSALDAHDLDGALKLVDKDGAFRGTVSKAFAQRDGSLVIIDFDPNFRTALTAVLRSADYAKFPAVRDLEGKEIVVTGKFTDFHGKAQIVLTDPAQIKLVK
jgi:DNA/RNA endonuclease YhcR with UshA esterase domain